MVDYFKIEVLSTTMGQLLKIELQTGT